MSIFKGSGVAIVTPFNKNGVDFATLEKLLEYHVSNKTDAIIICGTTGEGSTMSYKEKEETIKFAVDVINKRIPVIAGTGSNNTSSAVKMSKFAQSVGVDGLLVITPYYNKANENGIIKHFEAINNAVNIPIIVYNVPSRTGVNISPQTFLKLCSLKNITAIKEASGNMSQIAEIKALCKDKIDIYSGNDDLIVPIMSLGGIGVISVLANIIPETVHYITSLCLKGDFKKASEIQLKYIDLINALFMEVNPIPIKTAMNLMNLNAGLLRLPLCEMSEDNKNKLISALKDKNLIK